MRNLRLDICYDGTRYRGWQRLPGKDDTIQGKLETALSRILGEVIEISGSGRTDAGVHARGQVANFHCECTMTAEEILENLRSGKVEISDLPPTVKRANELVEECRRQLMLTRSEIENITTTSSPF